jgi:transposase
MEAYSLTSALDTRTGVGLEPVRRPEVLRSMAGRRRIWTLEQKLAIVGEMARCGNIAEFARQHDIRTSLLYTWRRELRYALEAGRASHAEPMFVPVMADSPTPLSSDVAIEVEVGGAVVRIGCTAKADLVAAVIQALQVQQ